MELLTTGDFEETTADVWENETTSAACNDSLQADGYTGNVFILAWYLQAVYIIAFTAMVVVAAGGNLIVIWIVLGNKRMRTVTNYFLVNLAVADTLITVFNTMFNFVYLLYSDWPFGRIYCKFTQFISPCTMSASILTFMAIAVERYMVIIHPLKPRIGAKSVLLVICAIWLASIGIAYPNLPYSETYPWVYCSGATRTVCYLNWPDGQYGTTDFWYTMFLLLVNYVLPLTALAATYTRVGIKLWGSKTIGERTAGQEETAKSKRKIVKMMIVIVVIFAICWLPQHVYYFVVNRHPDLLFQSWSQHVYLIIYWLAMSNAMYNPIIYCWMNARFRSGFKFALRWIPCVEWRASDAFGLRGFKAVRSSSLTEPQTRCTMAGGGGAASPYAVPLTERGLLYGAGSFSNNGNGNYYVRQPSAGSHRSTGEPGATSADGGRHNFRAPLFGRTSSTNSANPMFQYKYSLRRFDSG